MAEAPAASAAVPMASTVDTPSDVRLENFPYAVQLRQGFSRLRFTPSLEAEFCADYARRNLTRMRVGFLVAIAIYGSYVLVHLQQDIGPGSGFILALRLAYTTVLAVVLAASYSPLKARMTPLVLGGYALVGIGITASVCVAHYFHGERRWEGLALITFLCYVFSGLPLRNACAAAAAIFGSYLVGGWLTGMASDEWGFELFSLLAINLACSIALYLLEHADRENFLRRHIIREMAIRDGLTALYNRPAFNEHFERALRQAVRDFRGVALAMVDLDYFKRYNDHYGHLAGDDCLQRIARALQATGRRPLDLVGRFGGEEFIALFYGVDPGDAPAVGESLRRSVEDLRIPHVRSPLGYVTASVGVFATAPIATITTNDLIRHADRALYAAKDAGRNTVVVRSPDEGAAPAAS